MRIGNIEFRKPWVRYVDVPIEEQLYNAIRRSVGIDVINDLRMLIDELEDEIEGRVQ